MSGDIIFLRGKSLEDELNFSIRDLFQENCALAAAIHLDNASYEVYKLLLTLMKRGEDGSGIISNNEGVFQEYKKPGRACDVFHGFNFDTLPGNMAIGHNRYATKGIKSQYNIQPLYSETYLGELAIAHNGTLNSQNGLRDLLFAKGAMFHSSSDTELFLAVMASSNLTSSENATPVENAIKYAAKKIPMAYSMLVMAKEGVHAFKDWFGIRPLCFGKLRDGYLVASETIALENIPGISDIEEIEPGMLVFFPKDGEPIKKSLIVDPGSIDPRFCVFEEIYFSHPLSRMNGCIYREVRRELGRQLFREHPDVDFNIVVSIPSSGDDVAKGFSEASGRPLIPALIKNPYAANINERSYTASSDEERIRIAQQKLYLCKEDVTGKKVALIDETMVRSHTSKFNVDNILNNGKADKVIMWLGAPKVSKICNLGMAHNVPYELIAYAKNEEEIRKEIHADGLYFLSQKGFREVIARTTKNGICDGCFGGYYPTP